MFSRWFGKSDPKDDFAQAVIATYVRAGGREKPVYRKETFSIGFGEVTLFLANVYQEHQQLSASDRHLVIERVVGTVIEGKEQHESLTPDDLKQRLLPCVRERILAEILNLRARLAGKDPLRVPSQPLTEHLLLHLVIDSPTSMRDANDDDLAKCGISFEQAFELATDNLRKITGPEMIQIQPGLYAGPWSDCYAPSRFVLPELFQWLEVKGRPIAIPVNRNSVFISGSADAENHTLLLQLVNKVLEEPRPLAPRFLVLADDGSWKPWLPDGDTPAFDEFYHLSMRANANEYEAQKTLMDQLHQKEGKDIYVAPMRLFEESETKRWRSCCVWSRGLVTYLPKTDFVIFFDTEKPEGQNVVCQAEWEPMMSHVGKQMTKQSAYPERYRVETFPDSWILEELDTRSGGENP